MNHIRVNYEDAATGLPRKHDFTRSESENWRTSRDDQNGEDDEGGWRLAGTRRDSDRWCPPSPGGHCTDHINNTFVFDTLSLINVFVVFCQFFFFLFFLYDLCQNKVHLCVETCQWFCGLLFHCSTQENIISYHTSCFH